MNKTVNEHHSAEQLHADSTKKEYLSCGGDILFHLLLYHFLQSGSECPCRWLRRGGIYIKEVGNAIPTN